MHRPTILRHNQANVGTTKRMSKLAIYKYLTSTVMSLNTLQCTLKQPKVRERVDHKL